jgi:hypothetical protein
MDRSGCEAANSLNADIPARELAHPQTNEHEKRHWKSENVKAEAYLRATNYLRPHHGAGGFRTLHQFLLETESLTEVSDDMRELIEEEWPELVHKLPPKVS